MALIGFCSVRGAPGASTLALAVAHHWPSAAGRPALLVEADADGGVLAARYGLSLQPGLTELAGAARMGIDAHELHRYTQTMSSGVSVIVAHPAAEQTAAALRTSATHLAETLVKLPRTDVIVDLGRLRPGTPATALAAACDAVIVVVRSSADELVTLLSRLATLERVAPIELALVGRSPYPADEVRRAVGVEQIHLVPLDADAVRQDPAGARGGRSAWSRAVRALTGHLAAEAAVATTDDMTPAETMSGAGTARRPSAASFGAVA